MSKRSFQLITVLSTSIISAIGRRTFTRIRPWILQLIYWLTPVHMMHPDLWNVDPLSTYSSLALFCTRHSMYSDSFQNLLGLMLHRNSSAPRTSRLAHSHRTIVYRAICIICLCGHLSRDDWREGSDYNPAPAPIKVLDRSYYASVMRLQTNVSTQTVCAVLFIFSPFIACISLFRQESQKKTHK